MGKTRRWKRALAALLAAAALCGVLAVSAAAATIRGETPAYAQPYVGVPAQDFAKQPLSKRPAPRSGAPKVPTAQAYDMMTALLPLFVAKNHERLWGQLPEAAKKQYDADIDALYKKNGWDKDVTLDALFYKGKLNAYVLGVTAAYSKAVAGSDNPLTASTLLAWQFLYMYLLPVDIALYIVLP